MELAPASEEDVGFLQLLRNDPVTRAMSRRQHEFSLEEARRWVFSEGREFFLAREAGQPVGYLSFEPLADGSKEVSIVVDASLRGMGVGRRLLALAGTVYPGVVLKAEVKSVNPASLSIFKACGFVECGLAGDSILLERPGA